MLIFGNKENKNIPNKNLCYNFCEVVKIKIYLCIDLKTFYASVECVERSLDPFKTDLVVADISRNKGAICLAISPKMKKRGIKNRCRIYEIPKNINVIVAKPRMKKYIEYSAKIYGIYLKFVDKEDIHVYSIDEAFLDVSSYLKFYNMSAFELAKRIINEILKETGITAVCGIGTNMYLAKIALDIKAKHNKDNIAFLNEELYKKELWYHEPLTDFWQIGPGIENRLKKYHIRNMYDIAHIEEKKLYKEFGINARLLIDHSKGIEPVTIKEIKNYKPKSKSISNSQILFKDYNYKDARNVLIEMLDSLILELINKNLYTSSISIYIGYSKDIYPPLKVSKKLELTNNFNTILKEILPEYDYRINEKISIRRIGITLNNVQRKNHEQLSIFVNEENKKEEDLYKTIKKLQNTFGKNIILRAVSYEENSVQKIRNKLIGGHNAE